MRNNVGGFLILASLLVMLLLGCDANSGTAPQQEKVVKSYQSHATKGAGIQLNYQAEGGVQAGYEVAITLNFLLRPDERMSINIKTADNVQLLDQQTIELLADSEGRAVHTLRFIPQQTGKTYIKLFAAVQRNGDSIVQIFSVPIYVGDNTGTVTIDKTNPNGRVNLPSTRE